MCTRCQERSEGGQQFRNQEGGQCNGQANLSGLYKIIPYPSPCVKRQSPHEQQLGGQLTEIEHISPPG